MPLPFRQKRDMIILVSMPACRNGRRGRLKICCRQLRVGSSPTIGTKTLLQIAKAFFFTNFIEMRDKHSEMCYNRFQAHSGQPGISIFSERSDPTLDTDPPKSSMAVPVQRADCGCRPISQTCNPLSAKSPALPAAASAGND